MRGPLLIAGVEIGIIATRPLDAAFQIVRDDNLGTAPKVLERPHMAAQPVRQGLREGRFGIGVVGGTQHRHEHLGRMDLAGVGTDDGRGGSAVIDKAFLTGLVELTHGALLQALPVCVPIAELRVAVTAVGVLLRVFLPQQLLGQPFTFEFLVDDRPIGHLVTGGDAGVGVGIEPPGQLVIIQLRRQRPAESQRVGLGQQLLDGADTDLGAGADLANRQTGRAP